MELSVIIPALNEANCIGPLVDSIREHVNQKVPSCEILVVDGGSSDDTVRIAEDSHAKVIRQTIPGYGGALMEGFLAARGKYILTMDADLSHPIGVFNALWQNHERYDLIIASRYIEGGSAHMPFFRYVLSRILNITFSKLFSIPVRDLSSGFRLYKSDTLKKLSIEGRDFNVLQEILIKMFAQGYSVMEIPFHYQPRKAGSSKAKLFRFACSYLKTLKKMWTLRNSIDSVDYDERAYRSIIPLQRYWQKRRYSIITGMVPASWSVLLDVGCGSSRIVQKLSKMARSLPSGSSSVVAVEFSFPKLRYLKKIDSPRVNADICHLPFRGGTVDVAICSEVVEHINDRTTPFAELVRILRPGGMLIMGTPDYDSWIWNVVEFVYKKLLPNLFHLEIF